MPKKRHLRRSQSLGRNEPASDSDNERQTKRVRIDRLSHAETISPGNEKEDIERNEHGASSSRSHSGMNDTSYENFSSFARSFSFMSDDEDEEKQTPKQKLGDFNNPDIQSYQLRKDAHEFLNSFIESEKDVRIFSSTTKFIDIVLLQHPASVTLHGYVNVSVLVGAVSILGKKLSNTESAKVFSLENTGLFKVSSLKAVNDVTKEELYKKLQYLLSAKQEKDLNEFLNYLTSTTVVLLVEKCHLPSSLQFLELYYPHSVAVNKRRASKLSAENSALCSKQDTNAILMSLDDELIAEEIKTAISVSANSESGPRIILYGKRRSGKSWMLRYLINTVLNTHSEVYYLDIDPGQTEFTPPGAVSLTKITKPLFGPPYSHQRQPIKMIFTGSSTAETSPPLYIQSVKDLIDLYSSNYKSGVLFVNTMGWIQGIGAMCFESVVNHLKPTLMIELGCKDLSSPQKVEQPNLTPIWKIPARHFKHSSAFKAADLRNFALMSYLGKTQKYYESASYLNAVRPVTICWDNIAVYVMGKKVPANRLIEAVHCSVVALCYVHESYMLESEKPNLLPRTLTEDPINKCLGYGVVRAMDETNRILFIATPVPVDDLKPANTIIKGNILLPDVVYLKQPIVNVPLPYTNMYKEAPTPVRKQDKTRLHKSKKSPTPC